MRLEQEPFVQGAQTVTEQPEDRLHMTFAGMVRDCEIGNRPVVEVALAQIVDVVAYSRELEVEEALAGAEVAQMKQEVDLGTNRPALLERLALRCRQREEEFPVALGEARNPPQKLVLFRGEDLQAVALRDPIAI
jgi:hypothetical protein